MLDHWSIIYSLIYELSFSFLKLPFTLKHYQNTENKTALQFRSSEERFNGLMEGKINESSLKLGFDCFDLIIALDDST